MSAVDDEPLDLVEHRHVGGVGRVPAEHPARGDDVDRRRAGQHRADLHRRRVGAQHGRGRPRRPAWSTNSVSKSLRAGCARAHVEGLEVVPVGLHLGPLGDLEAEADEHVLEPLPGLGDEVGVGRGGAGRTNSVRSSRSASTCARRARRRPARSRRASSAPPQRPAIASLSALAGGLALVDGGQRPELGSSAGPAAPRLPSSWRVERGDVVERRGGGDLGRAPSSRAARMSSINGSPFSEPAGTVPGGLRSRRGRSSRRPRVTRGTEIAARPRSRTRSGRRRSRRDRPPVQRRPGGLEAQHGRGHRHVEALGPAVVRRCAPTRRRRRRRRARGPRCRRRWRAGPTSRRGVGRRRGATTCRRCAARRRHVGQRRPSTTGTWNSAPGRGAHDLRVERVDRARREHHGVDAGGLGRAQDRAEVAGVGEPVGDDDEPGVGQPARPGGRVLRTTANRPGGVSVAAIRSATPVGQRVCRSRRRRPASTPGATVLGLDRPAGGDRLADEGRALDDERTVLGTRTAAPEQAPQPLDLGVGECASPAASPPWHADQLAAERALAASTSAPKAAASVTARSARILRSTSMPAALSPAMNRL